MKKVVFFINLCFLSLNFLFSAETAVMEAPTDIHPSSKVAIIGGGVVGALESYYAHLDALKNGRKIRVVVYDKNPPFGKSGDGTASTNTAYNIVPSLTIDEILSVVPRGSELVEKLAILFSEPGGIRVDDVPGVNDSEAAARFKEAVALYGNDENHDDRTKTLLMLGKMSMDLWQDLYDHGDEELKRILEESNYNPSRDPKNADEKILHDGYRIDLIYDVADAGKRASGMKATYEQIGYKYCRVLSPKEVMAIDPFLADYCKEHSESQGLKWKNDCSALWRPGGCINTGVFLPKFYAYLKKVMGTYTGESGTIQDCFSMEFNKEVTAVEYDNGSDVRITGLKFSDGSSARDSCPYAETSYVFCPGEAIGTLHKFGFDEPAYAGFAGPVLLLNIPLSPDQLRTYKSFSHCMEVHKVGIVLAWQAKFDEDKIYIGVAGTKAFYGDQLPTIDQDFARNRHLVQLNMVNDVLPDMVSLAFGYDTKGKQLAFADILALEDKGILQRWVGRRAVAYDGFPTLGALYTQGRKVSNARCTTHLGSGGVSFSHAAVQMSRSCEHIENEFTEKVLRYADSRRHPEAM